MSTVISTTVIRAVRKILRRRSREPRTAGGPTAVRADPPAATTREAELEHAESQQAESARANRAGAGRAHEESARADRWRAEWARAQWAQAKAEREMMRSYFPGIPYGG
jgi:hypothetical protein